MKWQMKNFSHIPQHPNTAPGIPHTEQEQEKEERTNEERNPPGAATTSAADDNEDRPKCEWDLNLSAVISSTVNTAAAAASSDAIGAVEFDHSNSFFATGGIARKIRIYSAEKLLVQNCDKNVAFYEHASACEYFICTPAKLSSLKWKPGSDSRVIGSGDYDGVVTEYDLEKRKPVFERDKHGGKRVWSIDYSNWDPNLGASGSDDGTMQMWDTRSSAGLAQVRFGSSPVCSVEFNQFGGFLIAVGCADRKIYGYDVRKIVDPVFTLDQHQRAVTYTKFLDLRTVISSSIDGCLMKWDTEDCSPIRIYKGHINKKRFVGLSVWRNGGLFCCGSENNKVFVYDKRWGDPVWIGGFEMAAPPACDGDGGFVGGVCWRQTGEERCTLVAGGSDGALQVFEGERKSCL